MPVYLHQIETAVPEEAYPQNVAAEILKRAIGQGDKRTELIIHRLYTHSHIDKRHTLMGDFRPGGAGRAFHDPDTGAFMTPSTEERNLLYTAASKRMAPELAARIIEQCPGIEREQITHLITVSCTGFFQPGPDYVILRALGLPASVQRYHVGFMGCYAMFPALRMADRCSARQIPQLR